MTRADEAPGRVCLACKAVLDCQTGLTTNVPRDGDVSVCLYCGNIALYAANVQRLCPPTPAEEVELAADDRVQQALMAVRLFRHRVAHE